MGKNKRKGRAKSTPAPTAHAAPDNTHDAALVHEDPHESLGFDDLTPMQAAFVRELCKPGTNQTEAAIRAGYSPDSAMSQGSRLLRNDKVAEAYRRAQAAAARVAGLDQAWVLNRLKDISDHAVQAVPVLDKDGEPTGEYRFDGAAANKATELIGKHLGMFKDKLQVEIRKTHEEALSELE